MDTQHLAERGKALLKSSNFADTKFHFLKNNKWIEANKSLLALASPIFERMFFSDSNYKEATTNVVEITDIDSDVFEKLLLWIYAKEVNFESGYDAMDVFNAANKYEVIDLEILCERYILNNINPENACEMWKFGDLHDKIAVKDHALSVIQNQTIQVLDSANFLRIDTEILMMILNQETLWIDNEITLFKALERYGIANSLSREYLDAAVKSIRFLVMDIDEFRSFSTAFLSDSEKEAIVENINKAKNSDIKYPEDFSKSTTSRWTDFVYITDSGRNLYNAVREAHNNEEELEILNFEQRHVEGLPADLLFSELGWHAEVGWRTDRSIVKVLKKFLPREFDENNTDYLTRIFKNNNPRIIAALIESFKNMSLDCYLLDKKN